MEGSLWDVCPYALWSATLYLSYISCPVSAEFPNIEHIQVAGFCSWKKAGQICPLNIYTSLLMDNYLNFCGTKLNPLARTRMHTQWEIISFWHLIWGIFSSRKAFSLYNNIRVWTSCHLDWQLTGSSAVSFNNKRLMIRQSEEITCTTGSDENYLEEGFIHFLYCIGASKGEKSTNQIGIECLNRRMSHLRGPFQVFTWSFLQHCKGRL